MVELTDMTVKIKLKGVKKFIKRLKRAKRALTPIQTYSPKHVRIEFDNINEVPAIWIDGKRIDDMKGPDKPALVDFKLSWHTADPSKLESPERWWQAKYGVTDSNGYHVEATSQDDGWHE